MKMNPYKSLAAVVGIHFFVMFALTYVGVFRFNDIFLNLNRFYMAIIMVAPMVILMLLFMAHMFENKRLNLALYAMSGAVLVGTFFAIRSQAFVEDQQFLRSMIPHHSIAIKTCERANISDQEIKELCKQIVESQEEEINQMRDIMRRMD